MWGRSRRATRMWACALSDVGREDVPRGARGRRRPEKDTVRLDSCRPLEHAVGTPSLCCAKWSSVMRKETHVLHCRVENSEW